MQIAPLAPTTYPQCPAYNALLEVEFYQENPPVPSVLQAASLPREHRVSCALLVLLHLQAPRCVHCASQAATLQLAHPAVHPAPEAPARQEGHQHAQHAPQAPMQTQEHCAAPVHLAHILLQGHQHAQHVLQAASLWQVLLFVCVQPLHMQHLETRGLWTIAPTALQTRLLQSWEASVFLGVDVMLDTLGRTQGTPYPAQFVKQAIFQAGTAQPVLPVSLEPTPCRDGHPVSSVPPLTHYQDHLPRGHTLISWGGIQPAGATGPATTAQRPLTDSVKPSNRSLSAVPQSAHLVSMSQTAVQRGMAPATTAMEAVELALGCIT